MRDRSENLWWGTTIEAPNPGALAAFYSKLLDWPVVHQEPGAAIVNRFGLLRRVSSAR